MRYVMRGSIALLVVAVFLSSGVWGQAPEAKTKATVGKPAPDFALKDLAGKEYKLSDCRAKSIVVLTWWSYKCPWSAGCDPYFTALAKDYGTKGVTLLAIDSNNPTADPPDGIKAYCEKNKIAFPVLIDPGNKIADLYGANQTPEVYVIDKQGVLVYHGAVDNRTKETEAGKEDYVRAALNAILDGKEVAKKETKAFGCTIKRAG